MRTWHVLDNGGRLDELGREPVGTVLCVHGNPTWSYLWRRLVAVATEAAAAGRPAWRVVAVDQLEMGFSERTGAHRPLARRVRDLGDLTDALGLAGPVVTLGHDWGGVVSLGWAVDHPDVLAGVAVLNTAVHQPAGTPVPAPLRLALRRGVLASSTRRTTAFLDTTLALAHPPLDPAVKAGYRAPYRSAGRRGGIEGFVADIPADAAHPSAAELDRVAAGVRALDVPALVLWGAKDPVFRDRYLDDLQARLPHADVHRFETAGHLVAEDVDHATAVLDWLDDRFGEHDAGGAYRAGAGGATLGADADTHGRHAAPGHVEDAPADVAAHAAPGVDRPAHPDGVADDDPRPGRPAHVGPGHVEDVPAGHPAHAAGGTAGEWGDRHPLWYRLESLAGSAETALVELAPSAGPAPRVVSWRLLARRVREIAAGLDALGVRRGDRVSLVVPPGADLTAVLYACLRIGAVVVVADAGLGVRGLTRAVRGARPDVVIGAAPGLSAARALGWPGRRISVAPLAPALARALGVEHTLADVAELGARREPPAPPGPDDTAAVLFTSGSTGPAKGVVYTHAQLAAACRALATRYDLGPGTGLVAGFAPFALLAPGLGARTAIPAMDVTSPRTLTAAAVADAAAAVDATVLFLSPAALANVVATADGLTAEQHAGLGSVRTFLSAGAPVPVELLARAAELLPHATPHTPYGMTECLVVTDITLDEIRDAAGAPGPDVPGGVCVGRPAAGAVVRISALDDDGAATGTPSTEPDVTGEIVVSAPHLKQGYDRLHLTDRASTLGTATSSGSDTGPRAGTGTGTAPGPGPGPERWHRTGDVGHLDAEGRLWVEGRLAHVVVTADGVVTPVGVEQRVDGVPGVARSALVGVGPRGAAVLVAVVETGPAARRPGLAAPDLAAAVRAAAGRPLAAVLVVPRMPTDVRHNSKIDRTRLAAWAEGVLAGRRARRP
ncbi:alpha/beta fold hydrolase [Cellulomonas cellasea]|uniref:alpha/beta fold hydrolase n=1 Tax=Cellulomonas cellasea TaxID=43670 RepID=UPI001FE448E5|nr:alpha/beta fold hydrolase [Cellulomonas cellasea]